MRILVVSAMFPPNVLGGAEISAFNLSSWLRDQGHEIGVLMAAKTPQEEKFGETVDGMKIWSFHTPRPYPIFMQGRVERNYLKPLWHLQDHLDPRNPPFMARVLEEFQPDICKVHYAMGLGHNIFGEIAKRDIPVLYVLHDLTLACVRATMFKQGETCQAQCAPCRLSAKYKWSQISKLRRVGFCSPSRANLERNSLFQPLANYPTAHILNANRNPRPSKTREPASAIRFVYVGRLEAAKGIPILLAAAEKLASHGNFSLKVIGTGSLETELRARYGSQPWVEFAGQVPAQQAIDAIATGDMLCIPSVWLENSPGVVIEALGMSVPVIGSNVGGIPELVRNDENGLLVPPGDVDAWRAALQTIISEPERLTRYQANAAEHAGDFDQNYLGGRYLEFMDEIRNFKGAV